MMPTAENFPAPLPNHPDTGLAPSRNTLRLVGKTLAALGTAACLTACGSAEGDTTEQNYSELSAAVSETAEARAAHFGDDTVDPLKLPKGWTWQTLSYGDIEEEVNSSNHSLDKEWQDNPISWWLEESATSIGGDTLIFSQASSLEAPGDIAVVWNNGRAAYTEDRQMNNPGAYHLASEEDNAAVGICVAADETMRNLNPTLYNGEGIEWLAEAQAEEQRGFWEKTNSDDVNDELTGFDMQGERVPKATDFESPNSVVASSKCGEMIIKVVNKLREDYGPASLPGIEFFVPKPPQE